MIVHRSGRLLLRRLMRPASRGGCEGAPRRPSTALSLYAAALAAALTVPPAQGRDLKFATWNVSALLAEGADTAGGGGLGEAALAGYLRALDPDVIAIQGIGWRTASGLLERERYAWHGAAGTGWQRVGIAVRRGIAFTVNPDVTALELDASARRHPGSGADITLDLGGITLRVLAVDLAVGCRDGPLGRFDRPACEVLREQALATQAWIDLRVAAGEAFVMLGAFGREMGPRDPFLALLVKPTPLVRATEGRDSPCAGGEPFVDHILAGGPARDWLRPSTLRVQPFRPSDAVAREQASEHCPVSVHLAIPDPAISNPAIPDPAIPDLEPGGRSPRFTAPERSELRPQQPESTAP